MKPSDTFDKVLDQLQRFCAYQERSLHEVEQKLRSTALPATEQAQLIALLREENFLHEERFAKAFVRGKFTIKRWGRKKIASELYKHKVSEISIQEALDSEISEQGYQENIHHLVTKKRKELPTSLDTFSLRNKLLAYLIQKGYEPHAITDTLKEILRDNEP